MTTDAQALSASMENYLEAIFLLVRDGPVARAKDISQRLGVNRSSVTGALQAMSERGLVNYKRYGFVTLTQQGELRGCIGSLSAHRSLLSDLKSNAIAAALHDPRFAPLTADELGITEIEISLLAPTQPMAFRDEADALSQLRPNIDGVVLEFGRYRSTFLPQVWEQLPEPRQFMAHLKRKAGLPADFWDHGIQLSRYSVTKFTEKNQ